MMKKGCSWREKRHSKKNYNKIIDFFFQNILCVGKFKREKKIMFKNFSFNNMYWISLSLYEHDLVCKFFIHIYLCCYVCDSFFFGCVSLPRLTLKFLLIYFCFKIFQFCFNFQCSKIFVSKFRAIIVIYYATLEIPS
jgi:hypothetical protein